MKNSKTGLDWKIEITFIIIVGLVLLNIPSLIVSSIPSIALSKITETYTELYFTDHQNLPKQLELKTQYEFEFSVHNLENKDFTYVYEVTATDQEDEIILNKGQFLLTRDEIGTIPVTFSVSLAFERKKNHSKSS